MDLTRRDDGWWIEGADPYRIDGDGPFADYGPYDTRARAIDDLRGLRRFEKLVQKECPEHNPVAAPVLPDVMLSVTTP